MRVTESRDGAFSDGGIPAVTGGFREDGRAEGGIERTGEDRKSFVAVALAMGGAMMVPDDPEHRVPVLSIIFEGAQLESEIGTGRIGFAGEDGGEALGNRPGLVGIIGQPHSHEYGAEIGVAQSELTEFRGPFRDRAAGIRGHEDCDV